MRRIPSVMRDLKLILDTGVESSFPREAQLAPLLKTQVVQESETTKVYDANDEPSRIVGTNKFYVHVGQMTQLVNFLVYERPAIPAILRCDFCDQFVKCIYTKARLVELIDASTVPIYRHYGKQPLAATKNSKTFSFQRQKGCVSTKMQST